MYTTLGLFEPQSKKGGIQDLGHCLLSAEFLSLSTVCIYQLQKPPFFITTCDKDFVLQMKRSLIPQPHMLMLHWR